MKKLLIVGLAAVAVSLCAGAADLVKYVDPLIGSIDEGNTFPGACYPFGLVQPSPDSSTNRVWCSGYKYDDDVIRGFSQTHLNGTGTPHLGDVLIQPFTGDVGKKFVFPSQYDKKTMVTSPDYHRMYLTDFDITVEATASEHVSWYQFTYNGNGSKKLFVDHASQLLMPWKAKEGQCVRESEIHFSDDKREISGMHRINGWVNAPVYFILRLDRPYASRQMLPRNAFEGKGEKVVLDFDLKKGETLGVQVALSGVSIDGARKNLEAESKGQTFASVQTACRAAWNEILNRAVMTKGTEEQKKSFYTAIYHLCIQPNNVADVDGRYRAEDGVVRTAKGGRFYSTLSLWDTFRAAHPLYTILTPERVDGMVDSMIAHGEANQGLLPIWAIWGKEGWSMLGVHSIPVILDAWCKGWRGADGEKVLDLMVKSLMTPREDFPKLSWDVLWEHGFYPYDKGPHDKGYCIGQSVSRTLEIAYNWWCVEKFARLIGSEQTAQTAHKYAEAWKKVFDKETGFMRAKSYKGNWRSPFNPAKNAQAGEFWGDYTEASAWVYLWHVFQDAEGLTEALGGTEATIKKLDQFFASGYGKDGEGEYWGCKSGTIGMYWHGNEPSHHIPYFYTLLGRRDKCEEIVAKVCREFYLTKFDGLCGNDDCGQMSAWYIFSMLGFYPFNPAGEGYVWGAAQAGEVVVKLPSGKTLTVKRTCAPTAKTNRILLNGKEVTGTILSHDALLNGGELVFE